MDIPEEGTANAWPLSRDAIQEREHRQDDYRQLSG
jgi:hypothetical protein